MEMPFSMSFTKLYIFQGYLAYLRHFISSLLWKCQPFSALTKKDDKLKLDEHYQFSFEYIKCYLTIPLVLIIPILRKLFILYTIVLDELVSALLAQTNKKGKENELYYLIHCMIPFWGQLSSNGEELSSFNIYYIKIWHYMFSHIIDLISEVNLL